MFGQIFRNMPDVVKNLLIINLLMFLATIVVGYEQMVFDLSLFYPWSPHFEPYQIVTHMFMHAGLGHIFFNMFALVMFGGQLERMWGPKRFLTFYLITGLGAAALHLGVQAIEVYNILGTLEIPESVNTADVSGDQIDRLRQIKFGPTLGASGAIYGLLLGFGMLFPNTELMLIFLPIPVKAKYFIPILMGIELFMGIGNFSWDNMAHFAHLGGALFGFIMIKIWQSKRDNFY